MSDVRSEPYIFPSIEEGYKISIRIKRKDEFNESTFTSPYPPGWNSYGMDYLYGKYVCNSDIAKDILSRKAGRVVSIDVWVLTIGNDFIISKTPTTGYTHKHLGGLGSIWEPHIPPAGYYSHTHKDIPDRGIDHTRTSILFPNWGDIIKQLKEDKTNLKQTDKYNGKIIKIQRKSAQVRRGQTERGTSVSNRRPIRSVGGRYKGNVTRTQA